MKSVFTAQNRIIAFLTFMVFIVVPDGMIQAQQKIGFGIHFDSGISWLTSNIKETRNDGLRSGFNFGLTFNRYFSRNYSFSTGISLLNGGGRLSNTDTTMIELSKSPQTILPAGEEVIYNIRYLSFPVGLKLQTNQVGYTTFFSDLGLDPKIVLGGTADIPSLNLKDENADSELNNFNLSYHITIGIEYSLGGTTALLLALNYDNNFLDITRDNGDQPGDNVSHKILSLRIGVNF